MVEAAKPYTVAEAGPLEPELLTARDLIAMAALFCRADAIRFPLDGTLPAESHRQLQDWCAEFEIGYTVSVMDPKPVKELPALRPASVKLPALCRARTAVLERLCGDYAGEIHLCLDMTTRQEEEAAIELCAKADRLNDLTLIACVPAYAPFSEEACLKELRRLMTAYGGKVKRIGFFSAKPGTALDVAAYTLGAELIERRYGLDKSGREDALEPDEFKELVNTLQAVRKALMYKTAEKRSLEARRRQAAGIAAAKEQGVKFGRRPMERPEEYPALRRQWQEGQISAREAARRLHISHRTFLLWANETEERPRS